MRIRPLSYVGLLAAIACGGGEPYPSQPPSTGGSASTGGSSAVPGTGGTAGGAVAAIGGNPGQPGTAGATGGSSVNGGSAPALSTGGASSGGPGASASSSGGVSFGGTSSGGAKSTGGASSGGANANGGKSGGASSGGASNGGSGGGSLTYAALCGTCHGAKGEGVASLGPEIQHPVRDFSTWVVRNGRSGHPSFPGAVMLAFPQSMLPDATLASFFDALSTPALPKPTTGAALYADYCANCHGATGVGGPAAHDAKGQPLAKALSLVRSGHSLTQFSLRNGYMSKWSTSELTDAEVGLIVTHLDSL